MAEDKTLIPLAKMFVEEVQCFDAQYRLECLQVEDR